LRPRIEVSGIIASKADFLWGAAAAGPPVLRFMDALSSAIWALVRSSNEACLEDSGSGDADGDGERCFFGGGDVTFLVTCGGGGGEGEPRTGFLIGISRFLSGAFGIRGLLRT
jgi:hypothetical protein